MWYLINQLWVWLLLALILGLIVGWMTCSRDETRWWTGWVPLGTIAFLAGLVVAVLRLLPDRLGYMLDSALLMFGSYIIGCCISCLIKQWLTGKPAVEPVAVASASAAAAAAKAAADKAAAERAAAAKAAADKAAAERAAAAKAAADKAAADKAAAERARLEAEQPVLTDVPEGITGRRPLGLKGPRGGKADDLKRIRGIGKQNEGRLHALGVWHFDQIASWVREEIDWVGSYLAFPGRIDREEWVAQAKVLAQGLETEFSKRVARGEVETSRDDGDKGQDNVADLSKIDNANPQPKKN
jgi:predicted flap endonuclease-1-like 5' DNA nuclease